ncbi:hypothetical protein QBC33DRAFT_306804 [Phialemonium atrogriseum]|uniref:Rho-GAP domain-containing protein n=1 Tax=Phialemonium atrogriseum TaxID=1093897 RepID=A0AAJ0FPC7_9PEZI|nr:uncharacterized protein QBC33DRAFT_306804 [Phialemonium atrogriseum]KAK1769949.1 hypothetical protein QBC33DRAFT_306804 [Phialemonium atrogriseum]
MGRKPAPQPLTLADTAASGEDPPAGETLPISSTPDSTSSRSPRSPFRFAQKKPQKVGGRQPLQAPDVSPQQQQLPEETQYPPISSALYQEQQQQQQQHHHHPDNPSNQLRQQQQQQFQHQQQHQQHGHSHRRKVEDKGSKSGFFHHFTKSADRLHTHQQAGSRSEIMSRDTDRPATSKQNLKQAGKKAANRCDLRRVEGRPYAQAGRSDTDEHSLVPAYPDQVAQKTFPSTASKSDLSLVYSNDHDDPNGVKKDKQKHFPLLNRTRSIKEKDNSSPQGHVPVAINVTEPESAHYRGPPSLRTAPIHAHDRSFREMMSSAVRNHSAERPQGRDTYGNKGRDHDRDHHGRYQPSFRENGGSTFFNGLRSSSSKAADLISKGLFGKPARSGSTTEREPIVDDEHYVLKVINLPLVEQTRRTRISKRLEDSRDKTEFWMPAFPWRAIDYLNYKGSDVEGLYRVPGSGPQIKKWQRKFDEEGDVDLFLQKDLYDINIIGSMLKAWLRELPDELFPKDAQDRIARECVGSETVPQLLIDELSNLTPFNYYLLFAITCHLSLLLAHSDKNKMDFRNLCICFQPCMKIDAFCFKFLVCDWRDCWKGCKNEAKFIEEEYALFDQTPPRRLEDPYGTSPERGVEDRNVSSSDSSKQSNRSADNRKPRLKKKALPAIENASVEANSTVSTTVTIHSGRETPSRRSGDLRPLSPIQPLSPLGF